MTESFTTLTKLTMPETRTTKAASTQGADSAGSELVTMATLRELLKVQESLDHTLKFTTLFKVPYFSVRSPLLTVETRPGCDLCFKCTKWVP